MQKTHHVLDRVDTTPLGEKGQLTQVATMGSARAHPRDAVLVVLAWFMTDLTCRPLSRHSSSASAAREHRRLVFSPPPDMTCWRKTCSGDP